VVLSCGNPSPSSSSKQDVEEVKATGLSRFTTLDDTIEMLNDHIMDALSWMKDSFQA
jgi:hypothetical protein